MRGKESESLQVFFDRFMKVYNAIPSQFKPPIGSSQLQYAEAFDSEFTLWLSERRSTSLEAMMKYAIEVEVNLTATRKKKMNEGELRREDGVQRREEAEWRIDGGEWRREEGEIGERRKDKEPE